MQDSRAQDQRDTVPEPPGIVSVNSRGGARTGAAGKVVFVLVVVGLLLVGGIFGFKKYLAGGQTSEAATRAANASDNKPAVGGARRIFNTDPPARPGGASSAPGAAATGTPTVACPDNSASQPLTGPDGKPMATPSGVPIRVCGNGQMVVPAVVPTPGEEQGAAAVVPAKVVQPAASGAMSRYGGDVVIPSLAAAPTLDPNNPSIQSLPAHSGQDSIVPEQSGAGANPQNASSGAASASGALAHGAPSADPQGQVVNLLQGSEPALATARRIGNRDMILPEGRSIDCNLSIRLVNEVSGKATCVLSSNVYSDNGRVVLAERGSVAVGEYVALAVQGQRRLFVLWTRLQTPTGVVVSIDSPAADALGTTGLGGYVDNRWSERIGAAVLLSLVDDAIGYQTAKASSADGGGAAQGVAVFQNTTQTGRSLAERILDSSINIKPTIYKNQGDRATIFVSRDLDFGSVYELRAK